MKYVAWRFVWRQNLLEQEARETMEEIGVDIPIALKDVLVYLISCHEVEDLFKQLLLYSLHSWGG